MEHEDFVTFEHAVQFKELGFDWECTNYYLGHNQQLREWDGKILDYYHIRWDYNYTEYFIGLPDDKDNLFEDDYSAPTLSQAQKWLREVKNIVVSVGFDGHYYWYLNNPSGELIDGDVESKSYDTYETSLINGIDRALEILKEQNKK